MQQNIDKYPSDGDWLGLEQLATESGNPNPSFWILGPDGIVREFKLSDESFWKGIGDGMQTGQGLSGTERSQSC